MKVRFYHHQQGAGESVILADYDLPAVPALRDRVQLDGTDWVVCGRTWSLNGPEETVIVGLQTRDEYQQERDRRLGPLRRLQEKP